MMKEKIMKWYKQGLWDEAMVLDAVKMGVLAESDYHDITNSDIRIEKENRLEVVYK